MPTNTQGIENFRLKGTVIALHGSLVHYSGHNHSEESRHAYTMHFVDLGKGNKWSDENWLQRTPELPFRDYNERVGKLLSLIHI